MKWNSTADKLPVFLIVDHTTNMWGHVSSIERHLVDLIRQLQRDKIWDQLEFSIIGMAGITGLVKIDSVIARRSGGLAQVLPRCDLGRALWLVVKALTGRVTNYQVKGEIFVIFGNRPSGSKWQEYAQQLGELGVNVTPIAYAFMSKSLTEDLLRKIKTGTGKPLLLASNVTDDQLRWLFLEAMVSQIKDALTTFQKPDAARSPARRPPARAPRDGAREQARGLKIPPPSPPGKQAAEKRVRVQIALPGKSPSPADSGAREPIKDVAAPSDVGQAEPQPEAAAPQPSPPVVNDQDIVANWQVLEPTDPTDPVPHEMMDKKDAANGWRIIGASRRGKMHAHKGIYRTDAFALGEMDGWHMMVVADGSDSHPLSRVGSQLAADTAVETMKRFISSLSGTQLSAQDVCEIALRGGLEEAWKALESEADKRGISLECLGTTFLSVLHRPLEQGSVVGVAHVGDGLVAVEFADDEFEVLAEPDAGEAASVDLFLTSKHWKEWLDRVNVKTMETPPRMLVAMCDGVADGYIPFDQLLPGLFKDLQQEVLVEPEQPDRTLLDFLDYDKHGSRDDLTVTLLYRVEPAQL